VTLDLDSQWEGRTGITVRVWAGDTYEDYVASNGAATITAPMHPVMEMGVYSGRLATTNRARVRVTPSILDVTGGVDGPGEVTL
jgi:hypothetical protein